VQSFLSLEVIGSGTVFLTGTAGYILDGTGFYYTN